MITILPVFKNGKVILKNIKDDIFECTYGGRKTTFIGTPEYYVSNTGKYICLDATTVKSLIKADIKCSRLVSAHGISFANMTAAKQAIADFYMHGESIKDNQARVDYQQYCTRTAIKNIRASSRNGGCASIR